MLSRIFSPLSSARVPNSMGVFRTLSAAASQPAAAELEAQSSSSGTIIKSAKRNISQSPWKLRFLVTLAHQKWYPEAMAQMKFSPKLYSKEIGDILKRGADSANMYHSAIPEELFVKEIYVNKGASRRKMRIMGRGRTGIGYIRQTHVVAKLEIIDWEAKLAACKTPSQRAVWEKRQTLCAEIKAKNAPPAMEGAAPAATQSA